MRTIPALAVSAVLLASLTACAGGPFAAGCTPFATAGAASALVTAEGAVGDTPVVKFPTPIVSEGIEAQALVVGDGVAARMGDTVAIKYSLFNAATGGPIGSSGYAHGGDYFTLGASNANDVVSDGLECATVGSRIAIVASALAVHGGQGDASVGVGPDDSIVYVIDVVDAFPGKANGAPQAPAADLPAVVTAPNGTPGITIPRTSAPTDVTVALLQTGSGDVLAAGDRVLLKYTAVAWETGRVLSSTWANGQSTIVPLDDSGTLPSGVVAGLVGKTVNSQVLIVVPRGEGGSSDSTLVYVVDVLGIIPQ
ncbi:MAG: hypothetical protein KF680_01070 [Cryobacterium sp.]|nr:hypothetical protein [Cryobacterium sp.]